jgi:23S rRNA (adenine2503-C2)-methyltransferase
MLNLIGLSQKELAAEMVKIAEKPFRAKQIWDWIYVKKAHDFVQFNNFPKTLRAKLAQNYSIAPPEVKKDLLSKDGTRKWLLRFSDNQEVEMVFIPEEERGTLCVSSQVGCTLTCTFCHTGTQRLVRNLTAGEIIWQFLSAEYLLKEPRMITNIVFMGMGEPLFNFDNVKTAIEILRDPKTINFSKRRITVSTSGVVPALFKFCDEINCGLAISLHAVNDELRSKIMPINKKYPLTQLIEACQYYNQLNSQKITFEYVMLKGENDSDQDAQNLVKLIQSHDLFVKVNLIPFNPWDQAIYSCSSNNRIRSFANILEDNNISAPIRKTRGEDVMAACGQLKSLSQSNKLIK